MQGQETANEGATEAANDAAVLPPVVPEVPETEAELAAYLEDNPTMSFAVRCSLPIHTALVHSGHSGP